MKGRARQTTTDAAGIGRGGCQLAAGAAGTSSTGAGVASPASTAGGPALVARSAGLSSTVGGEPSDSPEAPGVNVSVGSTSIRSTSTMSVSGPRLGDEHPALAQQASPRSETRPAGAARRRKGSGQGHRMGRFLGKGGETSLILPPAAGSPAGTFPRGLAPSFLGRRGLQSVSFPAVRRWPAIRARPDGRCRRRAGSMPRPPLASGSRHCRRRW